MAEEITPLKKSPSSQDQSPLFKLLPAEIRHEIFSLALADYPDPSPSLQYQADTCYARPQYFAPRRSDKALLETCQAVYKECRFLPFLLREHTHWLTHPDRAPPDYLKGNRIPELKYDLAKVAESQGYGFEIDHLRVFAQMFKLEEGKLSELLETPGLRPRRLTVTIRHTDWWHWENDQDLGFKNNWIPQLCDVLPASVREIRFELETLKRKTDQLKGIAREMRERWHFVRADGCVLCADVGDPCNIDAEWSGSSTWHGQRWSRDETREGIIDYVIIDIAFRERHVIERNGGSVSDYVLAAIARGSKK